MNYLMIRQTVHETAINEVIYHGIPDKRSLKSGEIVNLDVTAYHHGYHGNFNEAYFVGSNII